MLHLERDLSTYQYLGGSGSADYVDDPKNFEETMVSLSVAGHELASTRNTNRKCNEERACVQATVNNIHE